MAAIAPPTLDPLSNMATARLPLLRRKPLGHGFACARPVHTFTDAEQKPESFEHGCRICKAGDGADQRPPHNSDGKPDTRTYDIEKNAAYQPRSRVGQLERAEDLRQLRMARG